MKPSEKMERLGRQGLTISVCCGPSLKKAFTWSVTVLNRRGQEFAQPFEAVSFAHAIEIAEIEIAKRGWE